MRCRGFSWLVVALSVPASLLVGCGDDGRTCDDGTVPQGGRCVPAPDRCEPGLVFIDGECVEPADGTECGEGTVLSADGTRCEPVLDDLCDDGQLWNGTECVDAVECETGTIPDANGNCVPDPDICPDGQGWIGGECQDLVECAEGTILDENDNCIPDPDLCPEGQGWVGGECVDLIACGAGTILNPETNECEEIDLLDDVDLFEGVEPNDLVFDGGVATPFTLPANLNETIILGGTIGPATNLDDDPRTLEADYDSWTFSGTAGQRILIEATAIGAPSVGFVVHHRDSGEAIDYQRFALPYASRNGRREVVLPLTGTYEIMVGERSNLIELFPVLGEMFGDFDGSADYTYIVAVTPINNPAPTTRTAATLPLDHSGDLADVEQFLVDMEPGSLVAATLTTSSDAVLSGYWLTEADYDDYTGDLFLTGIHSVPAGGLLVTADYIVASAADTGYDLTIETQPVVGPVDLSTPQTFEDQTLNRGEFGVFRFALQEQSVINVGLTVPADGEPLLFSIMDEDFANIFVQHDGSTHVILDPGQYYIVVQFAGGIPDAVGFGTYDLFIQRFDVIALGDVELAGETVEAIDLDDFVAAGDDLFLSFGLGSAGTIDITGAPELDLDLAMEFYGSRVLALDDEFLPDMEVDEDGLVPAEDLPLGEGETAPLEEVVDLLMPPSPVYVRLNAVEVREAGTATIVDFTVLLETVAEFAPETEPNNAAGADLDSAFDLALADTLGSVKLLEPTTALGSYNDIVSGWTDDFWVVTVPEPASVTFRTRNIGFGGVDSVIILYSETGAVVGGNDDGGGNGLSLMTLDVAPGTYYLETYEFFEEPGWYLLEVTGEEFYTCMPSQNGCFDGTNLGRCAADGSGMVDLGIVCVDGCDLETNTCTAGTTEVEGETRNDTGATAQDLGTLPEGQSAIEGSLEDLGDTRPDIDWYVFEVDAVSELTIETHDPSGQFDTMIWLTDAGGREIAHNDDRPGTFLSALPCGAGCFNTVGPNPLIVRPGTYYVRVRYSTFFLDFFGVDIFEPGAYTLSIRVEEVDCFPGDASCEGNTLIACNANGRGTTDLFCHSGCGGTAPAAACGSLDEVEPNNDPGTAQDLDGLGDDVDVTEAGFISIFGDVAAASPNDRDLYAFELDATSVVTTGTLPVPEGTDIDTIVRIYFADDAAAEADALYADDDGGPGAFSLIRDALLGPGEYLVEVEHWNDSTTVSGDYELFLEIDQTFQSLGDLAPGDVLSFTSEEVLFADGIWWLHANVTEAALISGSLTFTSGDADLYIFDAEGGLLAARDFIGPETFSGLSVLAGDIYFAVYAYPLDGDVESFTLTVVSPICGDGVLGGTEACDDGDDTTPGDGCTACVVDFGYTCDNLVSPSACDLLPSLGTFGRDETIHPEVFPGPVTSTERLRRLITFDEDVFVRGTVTAATGDVELRVSRAAGLVFTSVDIGNETFGDNYLTAGTYQLEFYAFGSTAVTNIDFTLISLPVIDLASWGADEDITDYTSAAPLASGTSAYHQIVFDEAVSLSGSLTATGAGDPDLRILNQAGTAVVTMTAAGPADVVGQALAAGTYYVVVTADTGELTDYTLAFTTEVSCTAVDRSCDGTTLNYCPTGVDLTLECLVGCTDAGADSACDPVSTTPTVVNGSLAAATEHDVWGFSVEEAGWEFTFEVDPVSADTRILLCVADGDPCVLANSFVNSNSTGQSDPGSGSVDRIIWTFTEPGDYIVAVTAWSGTGDYVLTATGEEPPPPPLPQVFLESFDTWPAAGWTIETLGDATVPWEHCDPDGDCYTDFPRTFTTASGPYAAVDSDEHAGDGVNSNLISPAIDLTGYAAAELRFASNYQDFSSTTDQASVDISVDGGEYTSLQTYTADQPTGGTSIRIDLTAYVDHSIQLRFHYESDFDWYWLIDEVFVGAE